MQAGRTRAERQSAPLSTSAWEEEPTMLTMRGINQRGGETWFVVTRLPSHGTLYQYTPPDVDAGSESITLIVSAEPLSRCFGCRRWPPVA